MTFRKFLAILMLSESNMRCLHWTCCGKGFKNTHETTNEYYDMIGDDIDAVAEMADRLGEETINLVDAAAIINEDTDKYYLVDTSKNRECKEVFTDITLVLSKIIDCIEALLQTPEIADNIKNVGIKSSLESMHEKYDLQVRFINKRKLIED